MDTLYPIWDHNLAPSETVTPSAPSISKPRAYQFPGEDGEDHGVQSVHGAIVYFQDKRTRHMANVRHFTSFRIDDSIGPIDRLAAGDARWRERGYS